MMFNNYRCFRYADMEWLIRPPIKFHRTKDHFYYMTNRLKIFGMDN